VGMKGHQVAKGLHEEDEAWTSLPECCRVRAVKNARHDAAQVPEKLTPSREDRSNELRDGEDVLSVPNRLEEVFLDPLAVGEDALLVAARTEVPSLAGIGEEQIAAAFAAADSRETVMQIPAFEEALEHLLLDRSADAAGRAQLAQMPRDALPQRAAPRIARAINRRGSRLHEQANAPVFAANDRAIRPNDLAIGRSTPPGLFR
jgi:hypothetical protein